MTSVNEEDLDSYKIRKAGFLTQHQPYSGIPREECYDGRHEKPWQRVPSPYILVVLGLYLLLAYFTQLNEDGMPSVVPSASIARDDWKTFSEESALRYLDTILGGQPRVAGTRFHLQKTKDLEELVNTIASQGVRKVKTDWQIVTGDFWINFSVPYVNYYQNASNIIAVLEGESGFNADGSTRSSLLVNCHYDSVPFAEGASDNGVFCAAMAEVLSRLSRRRAPFKHNIVFLFNGAEENPLQASHGFLKHPWARGVTAVINLDSAGMNGKPSVFQVTDPRILSAYRRGARRPSAQGVGEFLFTTGIIPSDTDFRIFRDFGQIQGIDIAFTKWGHVYHTRYDRRGLLRRGVLQGAGDTLLGLVAGAADASLEEKMPATRMVYFDYLNLFMVTLSYPVSHGVDVVIALFAMTTVLHYVWLVGFRRSTVHELLWSVLGRVCSLLSGVALVGLLTPIMVSTTVQMRYLTQPWVVVPMFWLPFAAGTILMAHTFDAWRTKKSGLNRSIRALQAMAATRLLLSVILLGMACVPMVTPVRYVLAVPLLISSVAAIVSLTVVRYVKLQGWQHVALEFVLSVPSVVFLFLLSLRLDAMMLPIMGRAAGDYPDYTVGMINVGMAVLCCMTMSGTELLFSRSRIWVPLCATLAACGVVMLIPFSPYQDNGPSTQRHYWFHSEMVVYNAQRQVVSRSSGVLVTKHDPYTTQHVLDALRRNNKHVRTRRDFGDDCATKVYCGLPLYRVAFGRFLPQALFLEMGPPAPFVPQPAVTLLGKACVRDQCSYNFDVVVAPHNLFTLRPIANVSLTRWSPASPLRPSSRAGGAPVYVIVHSVATFSEGEAHLTINLNIQVPFPLQSSPVLELCHHAHLTQHPEAFTPEYAALVRSMPKYFNIASFMSVRSDYVF